MRIKKVTIKNFRSLEEQCFDAKALSLFIGDNGTGKTAILEAINFALSPYFLSGKIKHTDFHNGTDEPINIEIEFDSDFKANLPDGYVKQTVECNRVFLEIKKREKASPGKAFSDMVVVTHYILPNQDKSNDKGWEIKRKNGSLFQFDERLLSLSQVDHEGFIKSFYFNKNRERQLQKGFNSSISSIFDDFNWRFLKGIRGEATDNNGQSNYYTDKKNLENQIIEKVDEAAVKKSFTALNKKLKDFNLANIDLAFIDGQTPFDSAFLAQKINNLDLSISNLGSGIEMIISLLFLETLASISKENIIILIDEPEIHLHPSLQEKFVQYLIKLSENTQIVLSTHSPYFFKNCFKNPNIELLIAKRNGNGLEIKNTSDQFGLFPWSPSWGEINYFAYQLPTVEFHNELYGHLQEVNKKEKIPEFEQLLANKSVTKTKKWARLQDGVLQKAEDITLMTYIRHSIHHPENTNNDNYTPGELKASIEAMINILRNP